MRFGHFRLERYGPFEYLDLPLDPTPGHVNLIVAPNGYGKSVVRHAIGEFLFGIAARTPMNFRFGTERMRLLADIVHDGKPLSLVRRKGNGNTLAHASGPEFTLDEARRLRGDANETDFNQLFGLDTALLRSGGADLIRSQGRLGQVLFAAAGGMAPVRDLLASLEQKRDDLGRAGNRHKSRPIWAAFSAWEQAQADLRRTALRPDGWHNLERQATETADHLNTLLQAQSQDAQERERLRTISACRPWLERLQAATKIVLETQDAPDLDATFEKRWRTALERAASSASAAAAAEAALLVARESRASLGFDPAWIAVQADIDALADLRGVALNAELDLPSVQRDRDGQRATAADLRRELAYPESSPLPPASAVADARTRLRLHPKLIADAATAQNRLTEAQDAYAATLRSLDEHPGQTDIAAIADRAALLRAKGDPAAQLDAAATTLRNAESALRASLTAVPDSPLTEASLLTTVAPSEPVLESANKSLAEARSAQTQATRDRDARRKAIAEARAKLENLETAAALPPPGALQAARTHRDTLWSSLLAAPTAARAADPATAIALDRAIRDADAVADAIIAHGREAAEATALHASLAQLETAKSADEAALAQSNAAVAAARAGLLAIATNAGTATSDLPTLRAFLRTRDNAVACYHARQSAAAALSALQSHLTTLGGHLAGALAQPMPDLPALGALLAEAGRRTEASRTSAAQRRALADQAAQQKSILDKATASASKASHVLAEWTTHWAAIANVLARPPGESPAATLEALDRIDALRSAEANAAAADIRIARMQDAIAQLAARVARLSALSDDIAAMPPAQAAEALRQRLQTERDQETRCRDADTRIAQATDQHKQATAAAAEAGRTLQGLRAALRADTNDAAEQQLRRAREAATARADAAEARRQLATQGNGLGIEALTARATETTAEADAARIAEIDAAHTARQALIDTARAAATQAATDRDQAGTGLDAAEAAQRREAAQAALSRIAEEALILHAAHALLQTALDRQARAADQPLLARISDVFRTITGGAQAGVRIEGDGQTMVALEANGETRKSLDQLSEGTSDQLYLALRIAALEDYATNRSPLPFIADDILQTFDDARTTATLHALAALSRHVQVIVLTHHPHVGTLAANTSNKVNVLTL